MELKGAISKAAPELRDKVAAWVAKWKARLENEVARKKEGA